ncbi:MAG: cell wall hydrolase [Eubacterium sp.]|nr:cell wall hydrolase [Eubacterium sp.]
MKGVFGKKLLGTIMAIALLLLPGQTHMCADTKGQINQIGNDIQELQRQQEEKEQEISDIQRQAGAYEQKIKEYNGKLQELGNSLEKVQGEIAQTEQNLETVEGELEQAKAELEEAKKRIQVQDEQMRERIRFIYEKGQQSWISALLEADSFAEFLNRVQYIQKINEYDRNQLEAYKTAREQVSQAVDELALKEQQLEEEENRLTALQKDYSDRQNEMENLIAQTKDDLDAAGVQIAQNQAQADEIAGKIAQMEESQKALEAQYAAEEAARLAEIRQQEEETNAQEDAPITASGSDETLLATLIYCEARGESYDVKLAVASVVSNRVKSSYFPNTISGVIYQAHQFSPVASGSFAYYLANGKDGSYGDCVRAAQTVIGGTTTNNFLYFRTNASAAAAGISGTVMGNMTFY